MVEKALIRIGCILFALVVVTACAIYLSNNNSNEQVNNQTTYQQNQVYTNNNDEKVSSNTKKQTTKNKKKKQKNKTQQKSSSKNKKESKEKTSHSLEDIMQISNDTTIPETIVYVQKGAKSSNVSSEESNTSSNVSSKNSNNSSNSSSSSSTNSSSTSSQENTSSMPEVIITPNKNNELAKKISQKHNIQIIIAREEKDYFLDGKNYIKDEKLININLNSLSSFFTLIPENALEEVGIKKIVLCFEHSEENVFIEKKEDLIFDCNRKYTSAYIKKDMDLIFIKKFTDKIDLKKIEETFNNINPQNFFYGNIIKELIYSNKNISTGYFLNQKSQKSELDDLNEIFLFMLSKPQEIQLISKQAKLYKKIEIAYSLIIEQYPCFKDYFIV